MLTRAIPWLRHAVMFIAAVFIFVAARDSRAEQTYVVQKSDTLTSIARKNSISVARLAARNGLEKNDKLRAGQSIVIPDASAADRQPQWNSALPKSLEGIRIQRGKWKYIVVHHSGTANGSAKGMDRYHREERHMENGLAYHFVIGNGDGMGDGQIAIGQRWKEQLDGGHLRSETQNKYSIGICLVGNFDETKPTRRQMESLNALTDYLLERCDLKPSSVKTHQQINVIYTRCPGRFFPAKGFLKELKKRAE